MDGTAKISLKYVDRANTPISIDVSFMDVSLLDISFMDSSQNPLRADQ